MIEDLYNDRGEYVKTVEWKEIQKMPQETIDGAWAEESVTVTVTDGGGVSLGIVTCEYDEHYAAPLLKLDYEGRQALIRALQSL